VVDDSTQAVIAGAGSRKALRRKERQPLRLCAFA
jgi:hypothetical protein